MGLGLGGQQRDLEVEEVLTQRVDRLGKGWG